MKTSMLVVFLVLVISTSAFAKGGGMGMSRFSISGLYGIASVSPSDLNTYSTQNLASTPALGSINTDTIYGGKIDYLLSPKWGFEASYEMQDAKQPTNITSPTTVSGAGFDITQNEVWAGFNYYLVQASSFYAYLGAFAGYPTTSHAKLTYSVNVEGDPDKTVGYMGKAGIGVMLGSHLALFFEGGYQSIVTGDLKSASGTPLTVNGKNVKADLSGGRADAGLSIFF